MAAFLKRLVRGSDSYRIGLCARGEPGCRAATLGNGRDEGKEEWGWRLGAGGGPADCIGGRLRGGKGVRVWHEEAGDEQGAQDEPGPQKARVDRRAGHRQFPSGESGVEAAKRSATWMRGKVEGRFDNVKKISAL